LKHFLRYKSPATGVFKDAPLIRVYLLYSFSSVQSRLLFRNQWFWRPDIWHKILEGWCQFKACLKSVWKFDIFEEKIVHLLEGTLSIFWELTVIVKNAINRLIFWKTVFSKQALDFRKPLKILWHSAKLWNFFQNHWSLILIGLFWYPRTMPCIHVLVLCANGNVPVYLILLK
jgi:hypothetical protein